MKWNMKSFRTQNLEPVVESSKPVSQKCKRKDSFNQQFTDDRSHVNRWLYQNLFLLHREQLKLYPYICSKIEHNVHIYICMIFFDVLYDIHLI